MLRALCAAFLSSIEKETFMQLKSLVLGMSLVAFACASAYANDASKNKSDSQAKPSSSQTSSTKSSSARFDFDKADKNKDGQLSRAEFDAMTHGGSSASAGASGSKDVTKPSSSTSAAKGSESKTTK